VRNTCFLNNAFKKAYELLKKGQSFPPNRVGRTFFNLTYKNDMCPLNMFKVHDFLIVRSDKVGMNFIKKSMCISHAIKKIDSCLFFLN
jgi:hypothetical protein